VQGTDPLFGALFRPCARFGRYGGPGPVVATAARSNERRRDPVATSRDRRLAREQPARRGTWRPDGGAHPMSGSRCGCRVRRYRLTDPLQTPGGPDHVALVGGRRCRRRWRGQHHRTPRVRRVLLRAESPDARAARPRPRRHRRFRRASQFPSAPGRCPARQRRCDGLPRRTRTWRYTCAHRAPMSSSCASAGRWTRRVRR
jgi:hypothetical protein